MSEWLQWFDAHPYAWPIFIFLARVSDVSIGTLRTIMIIRGHRALAPILGFFEVVIWVMAIGGVMKNLDQWYNVVAYAGGFATGNATGMWLERRLAIGQQAITLISRSRSPAVAQALRLAGYPVTEFQGKGMYGDVSLAFVVVSRREAPIVLRVSRGVDPDAFVTIDDVRTSKLPVYRTVLHPTGWRSVLKRK